MGLLARARRTLGVARAALSRPPAVASPAEHSEEAHNRAKLWDEHFAEADPWGYDDPYEQEKYRRTLSLLDGLKIGHALELACAEGHFTQGLAQSVRRLRATDVSAKALSRAKVRCAGLNTVTFETLDFIAEPLGESWDLIVCSEALYYCGGREEMAALVARIVAALKPGGFFLTAHARALADDPRRTGFDWASGFGGQAVADAVLALPEAALARSVDTELYRIDLFQRVAPDTPRAPPEVTTLPTGPLPSLRARQSLVRDGDALITRNRVADLESTGDVPILMYHRIADEGPEGLGDWRVTPARFEEQLRFLHRRGYRSLSIEEWDAHCVSGEWLTGRPVMLTFDDGYCDFFDEAWPILCDYGFSAHVFIVAGHVGGEAVWDAAYGPPAPLMGWDALRTLAREGCGLGSHLVSHTRVDRLSREALAQEARTSRTLLEQELGRPIRSVCLPHDYTDACVQEAMHDAGYTSVFGVRPGVASIHASRRDIVRVPVYGSTALEEFACKLERTLEPPQEQDRRLRSRKRPTRP